MYKKLLSIVCLSLLVSAFISGCDMTDKKMTNADNGLEKGHDLKVKLFKFSDIVLLYRRIRGIGTL
jgi:hypothetical protein